MSALGGLSNAHRVRDICERAHRLLAAGIAALEAEPAECHCFYDNGDPKFTGNNGRKLHICGRG